MAVSGSRARRAVREPEPNAEFLPTLMEAGEEMLHLKAEIEDLDSQVKHRKERYRDLAENIVPELMEKAGMVNADGRGTFTLSSGGRISLRTDVYVNVLKEHKPALFAWLRRHKLKDMIREDVHAQTLKSFVKERIEDDEPLPPMLSTHFITSAVLTRR
jgi:hypothetical protein